MMTSLTCDAPAPLVRELTRRAETTGSSVSSRVSEGLAGYLDVTFHTPFQVSTSGSLVEGVYAQAVTRQKILEHGDFGPGTFTGLDGEVAVLDDAVYRVRGDGTASKAEPKAGAL